MPRWSRVLLLVAVPAALLVPAPAPAAGTGTDRLLGRSDPWYGQLAVVADVDGSHGGVLGPGMEVVSSPTGDRLAVIRPYGLLHLTDADGRCDRSVDVTDRAENPAFSPDGTRLAVTAYGVAGREVSDIHVEILDLAAGPSRRLTSGQWPSWSPDGTQLAFDEVDGTGVAHDVYVIGADGTGRRLLVDGQSPAWSPDGTTIAFVRGRSDIFPVGSSVWTMPVAGGPPTKVSSTPTAFRPVWAPDGRHLYFTNRLPSESVETYSVAPDGSDQRRVAPGLQVTDAAPPATASADRYRLALADGSSRAFGPGCPPDGDVRPGTSGAVGIAAAAPGRGAWLTTGAGIVTVAGPAAHLGDLRGRRPARPVVGISSTPGSGYWLVTADGRAFPFGDARSFGSMAGRRLNHPVVGVASTPSGRGYWLVASDGGIFSFGDATFSGSTGGRRLNRPIVGVASTPSGRGYWLVASDGGIFSFGDARFFGSTGNIRLQQPIVGMASTPSGRGYWLVARDGGVFAFGDAPFRGSAVGRGNAVGITR